MIKKVVIRAFRATEDPVGARKFLEGHARVLQSHGVAKVTSLNEDWTRDDSVFVILVESEDGARAFGGARIHAATATNELPIQKATGFMDERIHDFVGNKKPQGTGELCGLWNSVEVAGLGIGSFFATMAGVVIAPMAGLNSLFALCAPYTVPWAEMVGCEVIRELGNNGTFYYPKIDLLATVVLLPDAALLETARPEVVEKIRELRAKPDQEVTETPPGKNTKLQIHYRLDLAVEDTQTYKIQ